VTQGDLLDRLRTALRSQYTIDREIGRGGMATVYLAQDLKHRRSVALKVLHAELAESLGSERFRREIEFAAQLQHPHILTVLDSGETADGLLWFTMPFVEGESLRGRLRRERQLPSDDAIRITREVAQALDYAHRRGVIHRDIKPENILLTADGQALVADFGIARALTGHTGEHTLTGTGMAVGTPAYMSPEQASADRHVDARSDVYGLGAVCYEMLVGEAPFTGPTSQAILAKVLSGEVPSVRRTRPAAPVGVDAAIQRALAPVPADRFATPVQFSQALEAAERSAATSTAAAAVALAPATRSTGGESKHPRRVPAGAALLGLGFVIGLGVLFAWRSHGGAPTAEGPVRVAVLPFQNIGDTSDAYFADGLTDAIRGKLTTIPGLAVVASGSSDAYRHTEKTPQAIAQELGGVRYLLVGKVRWAKSAGGESRVQVSPALIDVTAGTDVWQQPFDAPFKDVFAVQGDIAGRVVQALGVALNPQARQTLAERPTQNLAAYDAYLKGQQFGQSSAIPDLERAVRYYQDAIALDSGFAAAWAQLATAEAKMFFNGSASAQRDSIARQAVARARAIAPDRPETYLAEGDYDSFIRTDNKRALAEFAEGIKLAPSDVSLQTGSALVEQSVGQWDSALAHLRTAESLDPRDVPTARRLANTYLWLRHYPEAAAAVDREIALAPDNLSGVEVKILVHLAQGDMAGAQATLHAVPAVVDSAALVAFVSTYWDLFWVLDDQQQRLLLTLPPAPFGGDRAPWATSHAETYVLRGDTARARIYADSAVAAYDDVLRSAPTDAQSVAERGLMFAYLGRKSEALRDARRATAMVPIAQDGYSGTYYEHLLARTCVLVGEPDCAIDALTQVLRVPYFLSPAWLRIDPDFAPLRTNPKFQALLASSN
jgi:eukaryotic-like serine/threonine-protein kinase